MPVPFGFSVGDFIALSSLISNIRTSLQSYGGARADYQELERELEILQLALAAIKSLTGPSQRHSEISAIKLVALSCRQTLNEFYARIQKYEKSLGITSKQSKGRASGRMVQWGLYMQVDMAKMRSYIAAHVGTLNTLLSTEVL